MMVGDNTAQKNLREPSQAAREENAIRPAVRPGRLTKQDDSSPASWAIQEEALSNLNKRNYLPIPQNGQM